MYLTPRPTVWSLLSHWKRAKSRVQGRAPDGRFLPRSQLLRHPQVPEKEEVGRPHGRSAQLQALPEVDGSVRREKEEGTLSVLLPKKGGPATC